MANLRIVYDNLAKKVTSINASSSAGSLPVDNLLTDIKSEVWRATDKVAQLELTWATDELMGVVAIPYANFTSDCTIRVRCFTSIADTVPFLDTGPVYACPSSFGSFPLGLALGVNAFAYSRSSAAVVWFPPTYAQRVLIDIADMSNTSPYIEASSVVVGNYWSPTINCQYGVTLTPADTSKHERSDAGDLKTDRGPRYKSLSFDMQYMDKLDRNMFWLIMENHGMSNPMFISITPENADDAIEEQIYQIYGKLSRTNSIKYTFLQQFDTTVEIEEI